MSDNQLEMIRELVETDVTSFDTYLLANIKAVLGGSTTRETCVGKCGRVRYRPVGETGPLHWLCVVCRPKGQSIFGPTVSMNRCIEGEFVTVDDFMADTSVWTTRVVRQDVVDRWADVWVAR